jgi:hypothetical protein
VCNDDIGIVTTGPPRHHIISDNASLLATMVSNSLQTTNNYSSRTQHPVYQDQNTLPSVPGEYTRDPSSIYHIVNEPYSYTTGFHKLNAYFLRRFSANKSLRIAKFLANKHSAVTWALRLRHVALQGPYYRA